MLRAEGRVNAAKDDFRFRRASTEIADYLCYARVPVGHPGLYQGCVKGRLIGEKTTEDRLRQSETAETASNGCEDRRLVADLRIKLAAAPIVAPILSARRSRIEPI